MLSARSVHSLAARGDVRFGNVAFVCIYGGLFPRGPRRCFPRGPTTQAGVGPERPRPAEKQRRDDDVEPARSHYALGDD